MQSSSAAKERLCDAKSKVSAHYLIDENGEIFSLVEEEKRAWHAGVASWHNEKDIKKADVYFSCLNGLIIRVPSDF